jgi:hypothetical protein
MSGGWEIGNGSQGKAIARCGLHIRKTHQLTAQWALKHAKVPEVEGYHAVSDYKLSAVVSCPNKQRL